MVLSNISKTTKLQKPSVSVLVLIKKRPLIDFASLSATTHFHELFECDLLKENDQICFRQMSVLEEQNSMVDDEKNEHVNDLIFLYKHVFFNISAHICVVV